MRTKQLVPAETVEVNAEGLHVDGGMWRVGDSINAEEGVGVFVHGVGDAFDVCDRAQNVGRVRTGHKPRLVGQELLEIRSEEFGVRGAVAGFPPFDGQVPPFRDLHPGGDVGFVVTE